MKKWITEGFEGFSRGTFGNAGQNLYVSKKGILQRIFQFDLDRNGYVDLVFANCQNHGESAPAYVYTLDGKRAELPAQGALSGLTVDLNGDGYQDLVVPGYYDMAAPYASCDIYYGSAEGYSENYRIRIPTPHAEDCCAGDFSGKGKPALAFAMSPHKIVRVFEQTEIGFEWDKHIDLPITAQLVCAADLDGDGYDDLICRMNKDTETTIYWGSAGGLSVDRKTVLPELPAGDILQKEEAQVRQSEMEHRDPTPRLLQKVIWNGRNCFTLSTGKKLIFFSANADRQLERVLEVEVSMAQAVAVGDIDGDGYDDLAVACAARNGDDTNTQQSYIIWNGPEGLDSRERTVLITRSACDVDILEGKVLFCLGNAGHLYTNNSQLYTYPDFEHPQLFEGEDSRRCALIKNPDGVVRVLLVNHYSRSAIGYDDCYVYWGSKDGYSPENMQKVPGHCAVDALIADFNDDGWAELIIGNNSENSLDLDVGHHWHFFGENGFEPEKSRTIRSDLGQGVTAGDVDKDGYLELVAPGNSVKEMRIYSAKDNFETWKTIEMPEGTSIRWPFIVDVNKDGWLDLVVPDIGPNGKTYILWGGPEGYSMERSQVLATYKGVGGAAADLTKNGWPDIIIGGHTETPGANGELTPYHPHHSFVYIYFNGPEGLSEARKCVLRGDGADSFCIADFNNDGWLDIFSGSYHAGKDRDTNSFLYWNREGKFSEKDRDLLYAHSASGCMAADFNEDGYIDLCIANHKVDGDHHGYSSVWWNGPKGFNSERTTDLPSNGPHGMISVEIGNIMDRSNSEYYYSEAITVDADCTVARAYTEGDVPEKTAANLLLCVNGGEWTAAEGLSLKKGDTLEYRLELFAYNCLRTPRIEKVVVEFEG